MLASINCLFSPKLWFSWFLVWWTIFKIVSIISIMLGDTGFHFIFYLSRQSPVWFCMWVLAYFCGLWFQRKFNFQRLCSVNFGLPGLSGASRVPIGSLRRCLVGWKGFPQHWGWLLDVCVGRAVVRVSCWDRSFAPVSLGRWVECQTHVYKEAFWTRCFL